MFYSCRDCDHFSNALNTKLEKVSMWLIADKLSININKTKYIIFRPRQKTFDHLNLSVNINNEQINFKQSIKFQLGIIID